MKIGIMMLNTMPPSCKIKGFTLVELSIVIVIIGLLVGGVMAGSSIVRQAGLRSVVTELRSLQTAANTFKLQYGKYPGDLNNAYSYWGANCAASAPLCNGNGNGQIIGPYQEEYMSFKHLSLAGLIPGTYTGVRVGQPEPGVSVPAGPFATSGYGFAHTTAGLYGNIWEPSSIGNWIFFGGAVLGGDITRWGIITPVEMAGIDTKLDDGLPHSGIIQSAWTTALTCAVNNAAPTTYNLTDGTNTCSIKYRL